MIWWKDRIYNTRNCGESSSATPWRDTAQKKNKKTNKNHLTLLEKCTASVKYSAFNLPHPDINFVISDPDTEILKCRIERMKTISRRWNRLCNHDRWQDYRSSLKKKGNSDFDWFIFDNLLTFVAYLRTKHIPDRKKNSFFFWVNINLTFLEYNWRFQILNA